MGLDPICDKELRVLLLFGNSLTGCLIHRQHVKAYLPHDPATRRAGDTRHLKAAGRLAHLHCPTLSGSHTGPGAVGKKAPWLPRWGLPCRQHSDLSQCLCTFIHPGPRPSSPTSV